MISPKILTNFFSDTEIYDIAEYGDGHINNTYLVTTSIAKYILQQVNNKVFNINNLISNYDYLINVTSKLNLADKLFPEFIKDKNGLIHFTDSDESVWRVNEFIDNSLTYSISPNTSITERAGNVMGKFQLFLSTLKPQEFKDTIPDFHNPLKRLNEFECTLKHSDKVIKQSANSEIGFVLENKSIAEKMADVLTSNILPVRVTHNDTKLDNFLFSNISNKTYVIDLDTIMKGSLLFDFGDMVRSITTSAREDEKDLVKVAFRIDHFEALCRGFFQPLKTILSPAEEENLLLGVHSIIFIQGIRFLTDYISGNKYYKYDYPTHNLIRCRTQFKLLEEILIKNSRLEDMINSELQ